MPVLCMSVTWYVRSGSPEIWVQEWTKPVLCMSVTWYVRSGSPVIWVQEWTKPVLCMSVTWYVRSGSPVIWVQGVHYASLYLWVSSEGKIPVPIQGSCKLQSWFPRPGTRMQLCANVKITSLPKGARST